MERTKLFEGAERVRFSPAEAESFEHQQLHSHAPRLHGPRLFVQVGPVLHSQGLARRGRERNTK